MKKTVFAGMAVVMCFLVGSTTAFANGLPVKESFGLGGAIGEPGSFMSDFRSGIESRIAEMKETVTDMSAYEPYGLVFDESKGAWCYDGNRVGLFVDPQERGVSYLSMDGEVHIKAIRDENGNLTGLVELSADEHDLLTGELDVLKFDMEANMNEMHDNMKTRMDKIRGDMKERMQNGTFKSGGFEQEFNETHEYMQRQMGEMRQRLIDALSNTNIQ